MGDLFKTLRQTFGEQKADDPSGAAYAKDKKKLKTALDETDQQRKSQVLPQWADKIEQIMQILGTIGMYGGGGGGGNQGNNQANTASNTTNNSVLTDMAINELSNGFGQALIVEARQRGVERVQSVFRYATNNGITTLSQDEQTILTSGIQYLTEQEANLANVVVTMPYSVNIGDTVPPAVVNTVPDFYVLQYYIPELDPCLGYCQYEHIGNSDVIYTKKEVNNVTFSTAPDDRVYRIQQDFVVAFDPWMIRGNMSLNDVDKILQDEIDKYVWDVHENLMGTGANRTATSVTNNDISGSSSGGGSGGGGSAQSLLGQLLPMLQEMIQKADSQHLPNSVLDQGHIRQLLDNHGQNNAKSKMMVNLAKQALQATQGGGGQ
jgi:hypothetical protein